ncbi:MAG: lysylphosphatidylglycerol synthase transmembrane domain-containing protein [Ginsengibacter sp.]
MNKKILAFLKYTFFFGVGIFLIWWQVGKMTTLQKVQFGESLQNANYLVLIPIVIMSILSHVSRAIRWKILIEPMGYFPSAYNAFYAILCGYFANTFIPRAGEVLRCTMLGRYEKIPVTKLIGTILVERVFDLFCYFLFIIFTLLIQLKTVSNFVKIKLNDITLAEGNIPLWIKLSIFAGIILAGFYFVKWIFRRHAEHRHIIRLRGIHIGLKEGFSSIKHLKKRKAFFLHSIFIWTMYLLQIYVGFNALEATSSLGITAAFSVLSLATLAMIVSPGGIGAFPVAVQQVLMIYHIDNISFGWLMWGTTTGIVILAGLISFVLIVYSNKGKYEAGQPRS